MKEPKSLTRRYLLWLYKTTKESFERIERKTTQLRVDEYILKHIQEKGDVPAQGKKEYDHFVSELKSYIKTKKTDELKLKFSNSNEKAFHPQYLYLKNKLAAVEAAIIHFLGDKELRAMQALYEKEFTDRILQAREH